MKGTDAKGVFLVGGFRSVAPGTPLNSSAPEQSKGKKFSLSHEIFAAHGGYWIPVKQLISMPLLRNIVSS